jgi:hypothetical protein
MGAEMTDAIMNLIRHAIGLGDQATIGGVLGLVRAGIDIIEGLSTLISDLVKKDPGLVTPAVRAELGRLKLTLAGLPSLNAAEQAELDKAVPPKEQV